MTGERESAAGYWFLVAKRKDCPLDVLDNSTLIDVWCLCSNPIEREDIVVVVCCECLSVRSSVYSVGSNVFAHPLRGIPPGRNFVGNGPQRTHPTYTPKNASTVLCTTQDPGTTASCIPVYELCKNLIYNLLCLYRI